MEKNQEAVGRIYNNENLHNVYEFHIAFCFNLKSSEEDYIVSGMSYYILYKKSCIRYENSSHINF